MTEKFYLSIIFCVFSVSSFAADYTNDEFKDNASALTAIGADKAYTGSDGSSYSGYSGNGVTVAIVDAGTRISHQEFMEKLNTSLYKDENNAHEEDHGTHVAAIVGGKKDGIGMHGVAYGALLLPFAVALDGSCEDETKCPPAENVLESLAGEAYDSVKIINNSWGDIQDVEGASASDYSAELKAVRKLVAKDKLIVAAAGNENFMNPSALLGGLPKFDDTLAFNMISVVGYNSAKAVSDYDFLFSESNLAGVAKKWSIAAPAVDIKSAVVNDPESGQPVNNAYAKESGTSMAAPMVSGAAALVQEAFPYMGGKQIADVLFSTAIKNYNTFSPAMYQAGDVFRVLYFKDNALGATFDQVKAAAATQGIICGGKRDGKDVVCSEVTYEDVFGQGLLNVGDAVKGPAYFDAERLSRTADFDEQAGQFIYTVDTQGFDSEWSNDISQKKLVIASPTEDDQKYAAADVGLKKTGEGILKLSGVNSFKGNTSVEAGTLHLTGTAVGNLAVKGGTFALEYVDLNHAGTWNGNITVSKEGTLTAKGGTVSGDVTNAGTFETQAGVNALTVSGNVGNSGTATLGGIGLILADGKSFDNTGTLNLNGTLDGVLNNDSLLFVSGTAGLKKNSVNKASGKVTVADGATADLNATTFSNAGRLSGYGCFSNGTVVNTGTADTSLSFDTFESSGLINIAPKKTSFEPVAMNVNTLKITGGTVGFAKDMEVVYHNATNYTLINFSTLAGHSNFPEKINISGFIQGKFNWQADRLDMMVDYARVANPENAPTLTNDERKVAAVIDSMYLDQHRLDFAGYYVNDEKSLKREINKLRNQIQPLSAENLPLSRTMSSQIFGRVTEVTALRVAPEYRNNFSPMQNYRGAYSGRSGGSRPARNKVWGQAVGAKSAVKTGESISRGSSKSMMAGAMFGADTEVANDVLIGVTAGFAHTGVKQDNDKTDVHDYRAGLYAGKRSGHWTLDAIAMGGLQLYDARRMTDLNGFHATSFSSYKGKTAEASLKIGYDFNRLPLRDYHFYAQSYLSGSVNWMSQDAYREKGGTSADLSVNSVNDTSVSVQPGVVVGYVAADMQISLDVNYQRLLTGGEPKMSAFFIADTTQSSFNSLPSEADKDYASVGVNFQTHLSRGVLFGLYGNARFSENTRSVGASATFAFEF